MRTTPHRSTAVIVFLLLAVVLVAILTYQALDAARSHRVTAENVLRDYAEAAAHEFAQRISREFEFYGFYPVFRVLSRLDAGNPLQPVPTLDQLADLARNEELQAVSFVSAVFRVDLTTSEFLRGDTASSLPAWLRDTLPGHAASVFEKEWRSAVLTGGQPDPQWFFYELWRNGAGEPKTAYGFGAHVDAVQTLFKSSASHDPLLPPTLLRELDPDSIMTVRIVDANGSILFETGALDTAPYSPYAPRFRGSAPLEARYGGLTALVSLHPHAAERLIIGGLPRSRLPLLIGLVTLTFGVMLTAIYLLRREHDLARLRTDFVSNVSHELRTPLAQIRMFAETLKLKRVRSPAEEHRSLQIIDQEARRLTQLVENLLHFSRSERRATEIAPEHTDIARHVGDIVEAFQPLAEARGTKVVLSGGPPIEADVDRSALEQMLLNLLDNAMKYGPDGQTVNVDVVQRDGHVRVQVDDEGPGIAPSDRKRIWKRFWRHKRLRNEAVAGTGIGLSVVRELATMHGGSTWVEDAPGGGARFVVQLPIGNGERARNQDVPS